MNRGYGYVYGATVYINQPVSCWSRSQRLASVNRGYVYRAAGSSIHKSCWSRAATACVRESWLLSVSKRICFHTWLVKPDRYSDGAAIKTREITEEPLFRIPLVIVLAPAGSFGPNSISLACMSNWESVEATDADKVALNLGRL